MNVDRAEPTVWAYAARSACGCIRGATVDNPDHAKEDRRNVMEFMKLGDTIERMTVEQVRTDLCVKPHKKNVCPCNSPGDR